MLPPLIRTECRLEGGGGAVSVVYDLMSFLLSFLPLFSNVYKTLHLLPTLVDTHHCSPHTLVQCSQLCPFSSR